MDIELEALIPRLLRPMIQEVHPKPNKIAACKDLGIRVQIDPQGSYNKEAASENTEPENMVWAVFLVISSWEDADHDPNGKSRDGRSKHSTKHVIDCLPGGLAN